MLVWELVIVFILLLMGIFNDLDFIYMEKWKE